MNDACRDRLSGIRDPSRSCPDARVFPDSDPGPRIPALTNHVPIPNATGHGRYPVNSSVADRRAWRGIVGCRRAEWFNRALEKSLDVRREQRLRRTIAFAVQPKLPQLDLP